MGTRTLESVNMFLRLLIMLFGKEIRNSKGEVIAKRLKQTIYLLSSVEEALKESKK